MAQSEYLPAYLEGLRLYREEKYWESHEAWEELWRKASGADRHFLQALIQLDAALLHTQRSHWKGVRNLLKKSLGHLKHCRGEFYGIDVPALVEQLEGYFQEIDEILAGEKEKFDWSVAPSLGGKGLRGGK